MQPVISWMGNKRLMTKRLLPLLQEHWRYVGVFAGSAALLLAKEPSKVEVLNDLNGELISFYRVIKHHKEEFIREFGEVPVARQEFADYLNQRGLTDIQRAARWFYLNKFSFGGKGKHFGRQRDRPPIDRDGLLWRLGALKERLRGVVLECQDWREILRFYDADGTVFFIDPPYIETTDYNEVSDVPRWTDGDHAELAERVQGLSAAWLLTYNDHPRVRELYRGCRMVEVDQAHSLSKDVARQRRFAQLIIQRS